MSDDPTYTEIKALLGQLELCLISRRQTSAPEGFSLMWKDKLHAFAFAMDNCGKGVQVLRETGENQWTWVFV